MTGTPLDTLTVLMQSQGPAWATSAETMLNEAVKRNYTMGRVLAHKDIRDVVQGGTEIRDRVLLDVAKSLVWYNPNATLTGTLTNPGVNYTVPWSFGAAHVAWTKQHLGLNIESLGKKYRAQKYKDVMRQLHQELWTGVHGTLEFAWWAPPDFTNMESTAPTTRRPLSIPAMINEFASGLPVGLGQTSWTTKQQINPTTVGNERWQPYVNNYTYDATMSSGGTYPGLNQLFVGLSRAMHKIKLSALPMHKAYSTQGTMPQVIWTQLQGIMNYEFALLHGQDQFRGMGKMSGSDPAYPLPSFRGVPLEWIESLDDAAIYPTGTDSGTASSVAWNTWDTTTNTTGITITNIDGETVTTGKAGPRYYIMQCDHLHYAMHSENYLKPEALITPSDQPFTRVQWYDLWMAQYFSSLRRQALVVPGAATVDADGSAVTIE